MNTMLMEFCQRIIKRSIQEVLSVNPHFLDKDTEVINRVASKMTAHVLDEINRQIRNGGQTPIIDVMSSITESAVRVGLDAVEYETRVVH